MVFREIDWLETVLVLAATTVMVAVQLTLPSVAVMVALPGATPVTLPKLLTVATFSLEELRLTLI